MTWFGWLLFLLWLNAVLRLSPMIRHGHLEKLTDSQSPEMGFPLLSIIVPAKNEANDIGNTIKSLLNAEYPNIEIIAVNDRSTDDTGLIIDQWGTEDNRVKPVHISNLPESWMGKNHAMQTGADAAKGDFLLFTDGDVNFKPGSLNRSINYLLNSQTDHLCLIPAGLSHGGLDRVFKTFFLFGLLLYVKTQEPIADGKYSYYGIGAFNLIKASTYRSIGGHRSFKMDVLDDFILGKRVKEEGYKQELLFATNSLSLRWYDGVKPTLKGVEKNMFASFEYSWGKMVFGLFMFIVLYLLPYTGLFLLPGIEAYGFIVSLLCMHGLYGYLGTHFEIRWFHHFLFPIAVILEMYAILMSSFKTWKQGGIFWRGTFYSLETLKQERYQTAKNK